MAYVGGAGELQMRARQLDPLGTGAAASVHRPLPCSLLLRGLHGAAYAHARAALIGSMLRGSDAQQLGRRSALVEREIDPDGRLDQPPPGVNGFIRRQGRRWLRVGQSECGQSCLRTVCMFPYLCIGTRHNMCTHEGFLQVQNALLFGGMLDFEAAAIAFSQGIGVRGRYILGGSCCSVIIDFVY